MKLEEGFFYTFDGLKLFYRIWLAEDVAHPVFILHGLHEHSGRYTSIIDELNLPQFSFFSFDQRGHGLSEGERGYALSVDEHLKDIDAFWDFVAKRWPEMPRNKVVWMGHSFGGLLLIRYAFKHPERVRATILSAPCLGIRSWIPYLEYIPASFAPIFPKKTISSFVFHDLLSHDPIERKLHREDYLIHNKIGLVLLKDALKVMAETVKRAPEFKAPLLVLVAGKDYVVKSRESLKFFEQAGSSEKIKGVFPGFYHELIREIEWQKPFGLMRDFLLKYSRE